MPLDTHRSERVKKERESKSNQPICIWLIKSVVWDDTYPWQPREWQPLPCTITLKNLAEVRTNLQTHQGQQQEREGAPEQDLELKTTAHLPEGVRII